MKTALLMGVLTGLLMVTGYILSILFDILFSVPPVYVVGAAFAAAVALNSISYWYSDKIVLRMYGANIVSESIAPEIYTMMSRLCKKTHLPMPKIAIISSETPNAFTTGRTPENAVVAVTSGALSLLRKEELEAVLAHELGHIKNRDMVIATLAAALAAAVGYVGFIGWRRIWPQRSTKSPYTHWIGVLLLTIFTPFAALLIRLVISKSREYAADERGAIISGNPDALADALIRIDEAVKRTPMVNGSPATAHLFIVNPFKAQRFVTLLSTHPSTESRINRLRERAHSPSTASQT